MLILLKNYIKTVRIRQKWAMFFKTRKTMVFETLPFDFYLEEERQL